MNKLSLIDKTFSHSLLGYCSDYQKSEIFKWDRKNIYGDVVYTDTVINNVKENKTGKNYAWLIEPIDISPRIYNIIKEKKKFFHKIFTHEKTLLDLGEPYELVPFGCCWIDSGDQKIYEKIKKISIIASNKRQTIGHRLRHSVIENFRGKIDVYGRGWNPVKHKIEALKDYNFSIVIENCKRDYWFTEKLIDCLVTGTIPIYWGCPSIGDFFDIRGFIIFNTLDELEKIINNLSEEKYEKMFPYVLENFKLSKKYLLPDNFIYQKIKGL
jgi:hypothetical protein